MIQNLLSISKTMILSTMIVIFISLLFIPFEVNGRSMEPTLNDGDKILVFRVNHISIPFTQERLILSMPKRDSIIAFRKENGVELVKRVIALPDDEVDIRNQTVYLNGNIQTRGITLTSPKSGFPIQISENCLFVLGDNRNLSNDSRQFGCVPLEKVEGQIALRIWPLSGLKLFR